MTTVVPEPLDANTPVSAEIIAASPTALLLINAEGLIVQANAAAEVLLNLSVQHLIGRFIPDVLIVPNSYELGGEGAFAAYDVAIKTQKGAWFRADFLVTPLPERAGWHLISLQAGAAAHRMGHRLEGGAGGRAAVRIAAMLAHEIKNPLSGIRGAAQLLSYDQDEGGKRLTKLIQVEVDRITALIDRMEGFTDTRPLERKAENIHAIIEHAREVALSGFGAKIDIRDSFDPSLPPVLVHRDSMVQVVLNLLKNASETAVVDKARHIVVTTAFRHGVSVAVDGGARKLSLPIEMCVIDDGPGAPADIADQLFDPFVSAKAKGQGLGLALVDKLVRDMGGIVQYAREGKPERTVFRVLLPRAQGDVI